ncbi:MAG TPA: hypothetical protein DD473_19935 [Planctomycetaceae bacterium]|nr:hypothetical protein [Planctomycetaceae bacterium]
MTESKGRAKGWRNDLEDQTFLYGAAVKFSYLKAAELPEKVDPRGKIEVKDQGQVGACSGFSRSYCMEALSNGIGGQGISFSPMFSYLTGQKTDNLLGSDTGATISGGIKASRQYGNCPDHLFPFPGRYTSTIPEACWEPAEQHQLLAHTPVNSAEECRLAIGSGYPIYLGILWDQSMDKPVLDTYRVRNNGGGHAICLLGYEGDYFYMLNSWSDRWGDRGWAKWHVRAVESMIASRYSEFFAVSEIEQPEPRSWKYDTMQILG